jgi:hypothetical protein
MQIKILVVVSYWLYSYFPQGTCCSTMHTKGHSIAATFCSRNKSHKVQQVELLATWRRDKICTELMLHDYNIYYQWTRWDVSLQHKPGIYPRNISGKGTKRPGTKRQGDETARGRNDRGRNGKGTKRQGDETTGDETVRGRLFMFTDCLVMQEWGIDRKPIQVFATRGLEIQ